MIASRSAGRVRWPAGGWPRPSPPTSRRPAARGCRACTARGECLQCHSRRRARDRPRADSGVRAPSRKSRLVARCSAGGSRCECAAAQSCRTGSAGSSPRSRAPPCQPKRPKRRCVQLLCSRAVVSPRGAEAGTRTPTGILPLRPERSASTISPLRLGASEYTRPWPASDKRLAARPGGAE